MALFNTLPNENVFVNALDQFARAALTAANAYAEKSKQPTIVVNVNYEPGQTTTQDVAEAVRRAVRVQDR